MITEDQSDVVAYLSAPTAHASAAVELMETHASIVFLAGDRAWKLKRAVRYDYLDYSTADRRRAMCEAEVRVNRRTAPGLYRGVTAVTRQADGSLAIGGEGAPVDWLVEMARFDQGAMLDRLAEAGVLPLKLMEPLAHAVAGLHHAAESCMQDGGWDKMRRVIDGNATGFARDTGGVLDPATCTTLTNRARFVLDRGGLVLDRRRNDGMVRRCHGDLHLRNIVLLDGQPTLFDAIEFNEEFSSIDVLYDLAFLLMDLWRLGLPHHANLLWNSYLAETRNLDGLPVMPLFLSCRAAVLAKTTATAANLQQDQGRREELRVLAHDYLTRAHAMLEPPPPRLIAIGGLSGSGKSTLALDLALVRGGYTAIADAVFAKAADRAAIQHVAAAAGVPFSGLWLEAPASLLIARVEARGIDVSDAGADVVRHQLVVPLDSLQWPRLDASGTRPQVVDAANTLVAGGHRPSTGCQAEVHHA